MTQQRRKVSLLDAVTYSLPISEFLNKQIAPPFVVYAMKFFSRLRYRVHVARTATPFICVHIGQANAGEFGRPKVIGWDTLDHIDPRKREINVVKVGKRWTEL